MVSPVVDIGLAYEGQGAKASPALEPPSLVPGSLLAKVKLQISVTF